LTELEEKIEESPIQEIEKPWFKHIDISDDSDKGHASIVEVWLEKTEDDDKPNPPLTVARVSSSSVQETKTNTIDLPPLKGVHCYKGITSRTDPSSVSNFENIPIIDEDTKESVIAPAVSIRLLSPYLDENVFPHDNIMLMVLCNGRYKKDQNALYLRITYKDNKLKKSTGTVIKKKNQVIYSYNIGDALMIAPNCYLQFLFTFGRPFYEKGNDQEKEGIFGIKPQEEDGKYRKLDKSDEKTFSGKPRKLIFMEATPDYVFDIEEQSSDEKEDEKPTEVIKEEVEAKPGLILETPEEQSEDTTETDPNDSGSEKSEESIPDNKEKPDEIEEDETKSGLVLEKYEEEVSPESKNDIGDEDPDDAILLDDLLEEEGEELIVWDKNTPDDEDDDESENIDVDTVTQITQGEEETKIEYEDDESLFGSDEEFEDQDEKEVRNIIEEDLKQEEDKELSDEEVEKEYAKMENEVNEEDSDDDEYKELNAMMDKFNLD